MTTVTLEPPAVEASPRTWAILGRTADGHTYRIDRSEMSAGAALRLANVLNKTSRGGAWHHFYVLRAEKAAAFPAVLAIMPGHRYTTTSFGEVLSLLGIVRSGGRGHYLVLGEKVRGKREVIYSRFATEVEPGLWETAGMIHDDLPDEA